MATLTEWELWACADECIRQYGFEAAIFAGQRADELFEQNDADGARAWRLIVERINQLLEPPSSPVN